MLLSTEQFSFYLHSNGTFSLYRGPSSGTLLGTRTYALGTVLYYYLELTIHYTLDSFEVRNRLSGANVDTKASSTNATANVIAFGNKISGSSDGH